MSERNLANKSLDINYKRNMKSKKLTKREEKILDYLGLSLYELTDEVLSYMQFDNRKEFFYEIGTEMDSFNKAIKKDERNQKIRLKFKEIKSHLPSYNQYISINRKTKIDSLSIYFELIKSDLTKLLTKRVQEDNLKIYSNLKFRRPQEQDNDNLDENNMPIFSNATNIPIIISVAAKDLPIIRNVQDIPIFIEKLYNAYDKLLSGYDSIIENILFLSLHINEFTPMSGTSYVPLPGFIQNKKCCVNIKNNDTKCFLWSILASLYPAKNNADRVSHYKKYENELILNNIDISDGMKISNIAKFEKLNQLNINVFTINKKNENQVLFHSDESIYKGHDPINLILHEGHYSLIKNFSRYVNSADLYQRHACTRCFQSFKFEGSLNKHKVLCNGFKPIVTIMPEANGVDNYLQFENHDRANKQPVVFYCDFECTTNTANDSFGKSTKIQKHNAASYMIKIVSDVLPYNFETTYKYTGPNAHIHFVETIRRIEPEILKLVWKNATMDDLTPEEKTLHCKAIECGQCGKQFENQFDRDKVRDHDHCTGKYRGPLCKKCNLQTGKKENDSKFIPVVFHNLKGYDSHLIFNAFMNITMDEKDKISCIPLNSEKFISFTYNRLRFIDSYAFLGCGLEDLIANLDDKHKHNLQNKFGDNFNLVNKKGFFPYDWFNSLNKLNQKSLPKQPQWYSKLYKSNISNTDYKHVKNVWDTFKMKTFEDYHDLYLDIDVLGLADVFEYFRKISMEDFGLDPLHYYTLPGYSWDAMLKKTDVKLELLTDPDMHLFIEKGIRGGVSVQSHRHAKANNPYMKNYNPKIERSYNQYSDANNLYGHSMMQKLPVSNFEWMEGNINLDISKLEDCILEVDIDYPANLHDLHNDFPLLPEKMSISQEKISPYSQSVLDVNNSKFHKNNKKLFGTLNGKKNYVIHIDNLKYAVKKGLKLVKIHRGIKFKTSLFLKEYIDFNSKKRAKTKNDFEKDFYKLMNNAVFGKVWKTLEQE